LLLPSRRQVAVELSSTPYRCHQALRSQRFAPPTRCPQLGYDNMTGHDVLRQLLPADVEVPTSFETIGHVLHLNLKEQVSRDAAPPATFNSLPPRPAVTFALPYCVVVTLDEQHGPYERVIADVLLDKVSRSCP
jgi:hypothetical protein